MRQNTNFSNSSRSDSELNTEFESGGSFNRRRQRNPDSQEFSENETDFAILQAQAVNFPVTPPGIFGTEGDDFISGDSTDNLIIGGFGNDTMSGGDGIDTISYLGLDEAIAYQAIGIINKGSYGTDQLLFGNEVVIAPANQANTIDGSTGNGVASLDVNLSTNPVSYTHLTLPTTSRV